MLSHKLTSLRNHWRAVLAGDITSRGVVGLTDLVRNLDDCIVQAEALEVGVVPETAGAPSHRDMPLDRTNAEQAVLRYLRSMSPEERARAEGALEAMALACGDHLPSEGEGAAA